MTGLDVSKPKDLVNKDIRSEKALLPRKRFRRACSSDRILQDDCDIFEPPKRQVFKGEEPLLLIPSVSEKSSAIGGPMPKAYQMTEESKADQEPRVEEVQPKSLYELTLQRDRKEDLAKNALSMVQRVDLDRLNQDEEKLRDYLELADFLQREVLSQSAGLWLKGSLASYHERALQLLHSYDYDYDLAKFHILFPQVMAMPDRREEVLHSLTPKELSRIVTDAIIDLRGCKTQEAEEAIQNLRNAVKHRINIDDLQYYQQVLKKLRVNMPEDVEEEVARSREFSKVIKKRCGGSTQGASSIAPSSQIAQDRNKMKFEELLQMNEEALTQYFIITPEMLTLQDHVQRAKAWQDKATQAMAQTVPLKSLQTMLQEARIIPVNFENLQEALKQRCASGQALVEKIYNTFTKVTKTRTQLQNVGNQGQQERSKPSTKKETLTSQQSSTMLLEDSVRQQISQKEHQYRQMLKEAEALMITHQEVAKLKEHMEQVDQWKARVQLFLEDDYRKQRKNKEVFVSLIRETALFKFDLELTDDLQRRYEFIQWHGKIVKVDGINGQATTANEEENKNIGCNIEVICSKEIESNSSSDDQELLTSVTLKYLMELKEEGLVKGFFDTPLPEIQRFTDLCKLAEKYQQQIKDALDTIDEGEERQSLQALTRLRNEVQDLRVAMPELETLQQILVKGEEYLATTLKYLERAKELNQKIEKNEENAGNEVKNNDGESKLSYLNEILKFNEELRNFGLSHVQFTQFHRLLRPLLEWIQDSRQLIKTYYKSLDLQTAFIHLNLLEPQELDDSDNESSDIKEEENKDDVLMVESQKEDIFAERAKKEKMDDYEKLQYVLRIAENNLKILLDTRDFQILTEMQKRVTLWLQKVATLEKWEAADFNGNDQVDQLEAAMSENLPLPTIRYQHLSKRLRREKWLKRHKELKEAEKVKLKQMETLAKDSNHADIQDDPQCREESNSLQAQLIHCRAWCEEHNNADLNSNRDIMRLLEMGKATLKYNICDFVDLKNFHHDVLEWREITQQILNGTALTDKGLQKTEKNLDFLKKHIEMARELAIVDKELELLQAIYDLAMQWKNVARKILLSRPLAHLEFASLPFSANKEEEKVHEHQGIVGARVVEMKNNFVVTVRKCVENDEKEQPYYEVDQIMTPFDEICNKKQHQSIYDCKKYCICRRGDDGLLFMIECDSCKEWFHGYCVGLSDDYQSVENSSQQAQTYICIGCARAFYNFGECDTLNLCNPENQDEAQIDGTQLKAFTQIKRVDFAFFRNLIKEGLQIPLYLEELQELKSFYSKIERWRVKAENLLQLPLSQSKLPQMSVHENENSSSNDSDIIISTKIPTNQLEDDDDEAPQSNLVGDEIGGELLKLYIESESFPCEMPDHWCKKLLTALRFRKWHNDTANLISQLTDQIKVNTLSNNAKAQIKKSLKRQLKAMEEAKINGAFEYREMLYQSFSFDMEIVHNLCKKVKFAIQQLIAQASLPIVFPESFNNNPLVEQQAQHLSLIDQINLAWEKLQRNQADDAISYRQVRNIIKQASDQDSQAASYRDQAKFQQVKEAIEDFENWFERAHQCLLANQDLKISQQLLDQVLCKRFYELVQEGLLRFAWIDSEEKQAKFDAWNLFVQWDQRCSEVLKAYFGSTGGDLIQEDQTNGLNEIAEHTLRNPEALQEAYPILFELVQQYEKLAFHSDLALDLNIRLQLVVDCWQQLHQTGENPLESLDQEEIRNNPEENDESQSVEIDQVNIDVDDTGKSQEDDDKMQE